MKKMSKYDQEIIDKHYQNYLDRCEDSEPMIGEYVIKEDGSVSRIMHFWEDGDEYQTSNGEYILRERSISLTSGGCDKSEMTNKLVLLTEMKEAPFWSWGSNLPGVDQAINFRKPVRVWKVKS
jgi:hypothetical protein